MIGTLAEVVFVPAGMLSLEKSLVVHNLYYRVSCGVLDETAINCLEHALYFFPEKLVLQSASTVRVFVVSETMIVQTPAFAFLIFPCLMSLIGFEPSWVMRSTGIRAMIDAHKELSHEAAQVAAARPKQEDEHAFGNLEDKDQDQEQEHNNI